MNGAGTRIVRRADHLGNAISSTAGRIAGVARRVPAVAWIAAIGGLAWLVSPNAIPSYDYAFVLAAAQDIWEGATPQYAIGTVDQVTPLPHPLTVGLALLAVKLGGHTFLLWDVLSLLAFGLLIWSTFQLGRAVCSWPVGILASALVFTGMDVFQYAVRGYGNVQFAAIITLAAVLEVKRPRRGWPVMALLVAAGLLRPEAWLLSGAYWLWLVPGRPWERRAALAALAAAAPAIWIVFDFLLTGDPLFGIHHSDEFTAHHENLQLSPGEAVPVVFSYFEELIGLPVVAGAVPGVALGMWKFREKAAVPLAIGILATAIPVVMSLGGAVAYPRFFVLPAVMAALFFALAALGWLALYPGHHRTAWKAVGLALLAVIVAFAPSRISDWRQAQVDRAGYVQTIRDLDDLVTSPAVASQLRACRPIYTTHFVYRPYVQFWLDLSPGEISYDPPPPTMTRGSLIARAKLTDMNFNPRPRLERQTQAAIRRGDLVPTARNRWWAVYEGRDCAGRSLRAR